MLPPFLPCRAARTLIVYLQETNIIMCQWLVSYMARNPINLSGSREVRGRRALWLWANLGKIVSGLASVETGFTPAGP